MADKDKRDRRGARLCDLLAYLCDTTVARMRRSCMRICDMHHVAHKDELHICVNHSSFMSSCVYVSITQVACIC